MGDVSDDFRTAMSEWVELKKQLTEARKDMKVLNSREKQLKAYVQSFMQESKIDKVNLKKGKVTLKTSKRKGGLTKVNVEDGLRVYFQGDEARVEGAMTCIQDNLPIKESSSVSMTGVK
jgi:hypothetical protein